MSTDCHNVEEHLHLEQIFAIEGYCAGEVAAAAALDMNDLENEHVLLSNPGQGV